MPVADGGEGTLDVLHAALGGEWREAPVHDAFGRERRARWLSLPDGTAAVESAEAIPLDPARLDPEAASSRGLGELIEAVGSPRALLVCLGGTATMDAGAGLGLAALPAPTRVACDTLARLAEAPRLFGPQKGVLDDRGAGAAVRGARAAGRARGRSGGRARRGARGAGRRARGRRASSCSTRSASTCPATTSSSPARARWTSRPGPGKAPGEVVRRCRAAGVRCELFSARDDLSGDPARAREDLVALGLRLAR